MKVFYFTRNRTRSCLALPQTQLEYLDITVVLHGVLRYRIRGEEVCVNAGDVIVFQPGDLRERLGGGSAEYISFNAELSEHDRIPPFSGVLPCCIDEPCTTLLRLFEECRHGGSELSEQKCEYYLSALYCILYEKHRLSEQNQHVINMKQYIAAHLAEPITLQQISRAVYLSPNYCNRIFRTHTGMSLSAYIIRLRTDEAVRMILDGMPLSDISAALGYKDYCYFSRQFKKTVGKSPAEFRRRYAEDDSAAKWHGETASEKS